MPSSPVAEVKEMMMSTPMSAQDSNSRVKNFKSILLPHEKLIVHASKQRQYSVQDDKLSALKFLLGELFSDAARINQIVIYVNVSAIQ